MPASQGVSDFINRKNANPLNEDARQPPSARSSSQTRQTGNNASLSLVERQRRAAGARVLVPATRLKVEPETDTNGLAMAAANRSVSGALNQVPQPRSTFDDTDLDDTISSGLSNLEGEERYVAFTTDYNRTSHELLRAVDARHYAQQHGGYNFPENNFTSNRGLPVNWQEIVETEKQLQAGLSRPPILGEFDVGSQNYLLAGQQNDDQDDLDSQGEGGENEVQEPQHGIGDKRDRHEVPKPTTLQTRAKQMSPPASPPILKLTSTFTTTSVPTGKSSSYVPASEEEVLPNQPVAKRARVELDYDLQALKTMSYADLDKQPFEIDPRAANNTPPVNEHGMPFTLHQRLGNLSRMKEEDVRAMFLGQKDHEWEDTGAWFMVQFETQMRRLMEIRQERRMITLKYEMEVKRRQAAVAANTVDVEQELRHLKNGGRDLMERRVSPMK